MNCANGISVRSIVNGNQGIAMIMVISLMVILLSIAGGALLLSGLNLKSASNAKTGSGAIHAADAGIHHALALIASGGTFSYSTDPNNPTCIVPSSSCSSATYNFGGGYGYAVTAINDSTSPGGNTRAILISAATGPNNSKRKVKAYIGRSSGSWAPPSALYFTGVSSSDRFFDPTGRSFFISGNDTNYNGTTPSTPAASIPGIGTNDATMTNTVVNALSSNEKPLVQGQGYSASPLTPSVQTVPTDIDINTMAADFYNQVASALTCPPKCTSGLRTTSSTCPSTLPTPRPVPDPCIWGTDAAPQVTYISAGSDHIHVTGNVTGSGVLVLDGQTHLGGTFNFHGLVLVKQPSGWTQDNNQEFEGQQDGDSDQGSLLRFRIKDNAKIFGTMLVGPNGQQLRFDIKNSAKIYYSNAAITMVRTFWNPLLPQPPKLVAWQEIMQ